MRALHHARHPRKGFTLVELSIVLSIIALLVGGIVAGRSVIKAAELRSVMTDANKYISAMQNFNSQYRGLPGDIRNAATYWSGAANGDGNGQIDSDTAGSEMYQFWYQLYQAGFMEQSLTGAPIAFSIVIGRNIPKSRIATAGFGVLYYNQVAAASSSQYFQNYGNTLTFGGYIINQPAWKVVLNPADAATIDQKTDDGVPGTGKWMAALTGGANFGTANACSTDANSVTTTGTYNTGIGDVIACSFFIKTGF